MATNGEQPVQKGKKDDDNRPRNEYRNHRTNPWLFGLTIGFFAGLFWGATRWLFYWFKFTIEIPGIMAEPFFKHSFLMTGWGMAVGYGFYIVFSILAAYLYLFTMSKLRGPWPGVLYGVLWWLIIFVFAGPALQMTQAITKAGWNTLTSELCIFLLWGLFIGYSTSFEYTDEASREPIGAF
ncbi:YqhR family membrane protein [Paenibacillus sp. NPDC058071]|uniref:YqhR family membrane protein n=1 Tax=Paenibacillus sp. NPDC058071 TaxID=3346326 RepID=UPI0036DC7F7C